MDSKHLPEEFRIKEGAEDFPLMVVLSVTFVCNAKCPQCPYTQSDIRAAYKDAPFMSSIIFKKIADECGRFGSYMRLSGGGEPLLHPQLPELIEYAKTAGARVGLITNGSLLTQEKVDHLLKADTDMIEVSVDASDSETYSKIRIGLDFDRLVKHLRYAVKRRNEWQCPTRVVVSVVNQKLIEGKLDQIVDFWNAVADNVIVRKYLTWGIGDESWSADPTPYIPDHRVPCPFPFERLNVDTRGDIMFCGYDIAGETCSVFGNVMEKSIRQIWQGDRFTEWRELLLAGEYEKIEICGKCLDWRYRSWKYNYWNVVEHAEKTRQERVEDINRRDKNLPRSEQRQD
jgi:MoaA/NifB/PqqE/SkfB family radical SAM enzyme